MESSDWSTHEDRDAHPEPKPIPKRFRVPRDANLLIIALAVIAGLAIVAATTASIIALTSIGKEQKRSDRNRVQTARSICDTLNGNAKANNNLTDFLGVILEVSAAQRGRPTSAQPLLDELGKRKVPVLNCEDFTDAIAANRRPPAAQPPPPPPDLEELRRKLEARG